MVKKVYEMDVPLILHCNGDAAIDAFLEAYEFARAGDYSKPWNVTTIHTQFMRKDQIPKFVQYKVRPSFYTLHTFYFAEAHLANRGKEQAMYISPMRDAIDAGLRPSNHTDFVVAPLDQMTMLWSAVNRISRGGAEIGLDQRVTAYEGLKAMTEWVAEQYDEQATKGTLETGKLADLVILDKDPLKVDPMAIKDIKVVETIKEGKTIYPASGWRAKAKDRFRQQDAGQDVFVAHRSLRHGWRQPGRPQGVDADCSERQGDRYRKTSHHEIRGRHARHLRRRQPSVRKLCLGRQQRHHGCAGQHHDGGRSEADGIGRQLREDACLGRRLQGHRRRTDAFQQWNGRRQVSVGSMSRIADG